MQCAEESPSNSQRRFSTLTFLMKNKSLNIHRRKFLQTGLAAGAVAGFGMSAVRAAEAKPVLKGMPVAISSANGLRATDKAMEMIKAGADTLDAVIAGVNIVEEDPNDMTVGYGGLPNERGVVELDA